MIKRLVLGLIYGLLVGAAVTAAVIKGLGMLTFMGTGGTVLAYVFASVTGVLVGLIAGKPIWASGGQIEAGLKAVAGAIVGAGAMFAMRRWLGVELDLHGLGVGPAFAEPAGMLPAVTIPAIAALLGAFYEADNTPAEDADKDKGPKSKGKESGKSKVRVAEGEGQDEEEESAHAKKNGAAKR